MTPTQYTDLARLPFDNIGTFTQGDFVYECEHDLDDFKYKSRLTCPIAIKADVMEALVRTVWPEDDTPYDETEVATIIWQENSQQGA